MKAKVKRGKGFGGALRYVLDEGKKATGDKKPEIVASNMSGSNAKELAQEFGKIKALRSDVAKPVWHTSLSLPVGERLDTATWGRVVHRFLEEMELDPDARQFVATRHNDTDKDHIHIIANRIALDGSLWHGKWEAKTAIAATQLLEKEFGLTLTAGPDELDESGNRKPRPKKKLTEGEIQMSARTDEVAPRLALQNILDKALDGASESNQLDVFAFMERVEAAGATALPNIAKTGRISGFSFAYQGIAFKGSDLGDSYKWSDRGFKKSIAYEQDRQGAELRERAQELKRQADQLNHAEPARTDDRVARPESKLGGDLRQHDDTQRRPTAQGEAVREPVGERRSGVKAVHEQSDQNPQAAGTERETDSRVGRNDQAAQRLEGAVRDRDSRPDSWGDVNRDLGDLAAVAAADPVQRAGVATAVLTGDAAIKAKAWRRQHEALAAQSYRITLMPRTGGKPWNVGKQGDRERFWTAGEVERMIPKLRRENARGRDIYITPIDDRNHYLVVDDLTPESLKELEADGYQPALVQESSENNLQAILKVPKQGVENEQSCGNDLVVELNKKYGDPKFSGVVHPFRMAGFSNKKQGRQNAFTRVVTGLNRVCQKALTKLKEIVAKREAAAKMEAERKQKEAEQHQRQQRLAIINGQAVAPYSALEPEVIETFRFEWKKAFGLAKKLVASGKWKEIDESRIDFSVAQQMLREGHAPIAVERAIWEGSPNIGDRQKGQDYASRTVQKAAEAVRKETAKKASPQVAPKSRNPYDGFGRPK